MNKVPEDQMRELMEHNSMHRHGGISEGSELNLDQLPLYAAQVYDAMVRSQGPTTVSMLASEMGLDQKDIRKGIKVLREHRYVVVDRISPPRSKRAMLFSVNRYRWNGATDGT